MQLDYSCCNIQVESKDLTHLEYLQLRILVFNPSGNYLIASYNVLVNSSNTTMKFFVFKGFTGFQARKMLLTIDSSAHAWLLSASVAPPTTE